MKIPVTDTAVDQYVALLRAGGPLGKVFPARLSDCDFTPSQREKIRKARMDRKLALKNGHSSAANSLPPSTASSLPRPNPPSPKPVTPKSVPALTKMGKLLYLQNGRCFFCGLPLAEADASVEHLNPKSRGGTKAEDNEVVCHRTLNHAFGDMDLKRKFEFILKTKGSFRCPGT